MQTNPIDRITHWSTDGDVVQFRYDIDHLKFVFNVRPYTVCDVLRDIERLADDNASPMTRDDAIHLKKLILDVMDIMEAYSEEPCNCELCAGSNRAEQVWAILMFICSAAIMVTAAMFLLWGLQ